MQPQAVHVPYTTRTPRQLVTRFVQDDVVLAFQGVDWSRPYGGKVLASGLGCFLLPPELDTTTAEFVARDGTRTPCPVQQLVEDLDTFDDLYLRVLEACDTRKVADLATAPLGAPSPDAFMFSYHRKIVNPAWRQRVPGDGLPPTRTIWARFDGALTREDLLRVLAGQPPEDAVLVKRDLTSGGPEAWRQAAPGSLLAREVAVRAAHEIQAHAAGTRECVASWTL